MVSKLNIAPHAVFVITQAGCGPINYKKKLNPHKIVKLQNDVAFNSLGEKVVNKKCRPKNGCNDVIKF